jgi:hypothetical protein
MKPSVYVETSIVSYLTAFPSQDVIRRGQQEVTKKWWSGPRMDYALFTSRFALMEAAAGDSVAAADRLAVLNRIDRLEVTSDVEPLAKKLLAIRALPAKARLDALHLAVATVGGMDFLLTWNCRHLANAKMWHTIDRGCRTAGYEPPRICTPFELLNLP